MALINDIFVFVESEAVSRSTEVSTHPVEEGIELSDHARRAPLTLSISGELAGEEYEEDAAELESFQKEGELVEYAGLNFLSEALITRFDTDHSAAIAGGCSFEMELKEVRIAASPFVAGSGNNGEQQIVEAPVPAAGEPPVRTHEVKNGDCLWKLAKSYYGNGSLFPKIFDANRDKLSDPDVIKAGQILVIP